MRYCIECKQPMPEGKRSDAICCSKTCSRRRCARNCYQKNKEHYREICREKKRRQYWEDPGLSRLKSRSKRSRNIEKVRKQERDRRNRDIDKTRDQQAASYQRNKDHRREYMRAWQKKNRGLVRRHASQYKARKLKAFPKWLGLRDKEKISAMYEFCPPGFEVDHIVPLKGDTACGLHVPWNLQFLEKAENIRKGNRICDSATINGMHAA